MRKSILLAAASVGAILAANPVQAQESDDSPKVQRGDIIVTARKRQESVLKVPVVETVITPEMLENRQVTSIDSRLTASAASGPNCVAAAASAVKACRRSV